MKLGTVAPNGATYFRSKDIEDCRDFLRERGLITAGVDCKCPTYMGWHSHTDQRRGIISFDKGRWYAGVWVK